MYFTEPSVFEKIFCSIGPWSLQTSRRRVAFAGMLIHAGHGVAATAAAFARRRRPQ